MRPSVLLVCAVAAPLYAQVPAAPEFLVNSYTTGLQRYGAVACNPDGDFVVVWTSYGQDGSAAGVFGRRFRPDGTAAGAEFRVNTYTTNEQSFPSVGMDAEGGFVVVWRSFPQDGSNVGVFGQRFAADGTAVGSEFRVNTYTTGFQGTAAVAVAAGGRFVVAWASADGSSSGVFAQRFDADGNREGGEFRVNSETTGNQGYPTPAMLADGGFAVAWDGYGSADPSSTGVFGRRYDAAGDPVGGQFLVNTTTTGRQFVPSITGTGDDGGFVVAWGGNDESYYGIFAQRFESSGSPRGGELKLDTFDGNQSWPSIAAGRRGFTVVWMADFQDGDGGAVMGRRVGASGLPRGPEFAVNTYTTYNQTLTRRPSAIAADGRGNFVVTWHGPGDGSSYGILARRFGSPRVAAADRP